MALPATMAATFFEHARQHHSDAAFVKQQRHRKKVQICDAMLEAGDDESRDGKHDRNHLVDDAASCHAHPHAKAYHGVAQNAAEESRPERKCHLCFGNVEVFALNRAIIHLGVVGQVDQECQPKGANQVSQKTIAQFRRTSVVEINPRARAMTSRLLPVKSSAPATTTMTRPRQKVNPPPSTCLAA